METSKLTLEEYGNKDFFYLQDIVFIWFDRKPNREILDNSMPPSITKLIKDISTLNPLNKDDDFIIQFSLSYIKQSLGSGDLVFLPSHCYSNNWLPSIGDWLLFDQNKQKKLQNVETFTIKKAKTWRDQVYSRNDLMVLAKQRAQKPPFLFPNEEDDFEAWLALKEAYASNEYQQKISRDKSDIKLKKLPNKVKIGDRRLQSLNDFVACVRRANKENGLPNKPYHFPCKIRGIFDALNEWEDQRIKRKVISEKVWDIVFNTFEKQFWENNVERRAICRGIKTGFTPDDVFFKKLNLIEYL